MMTDAMNGGNHGSEHGAPALRRLLMVVAAASLIGVFPFLSGLLGALMLYVMTRGIHARLARVMPPRIAAFTVVLAVFALIAGPGTWLVATIVSEGGAALRSWLAGDPIAWLSRTPLGGFDVTKTIANAGTTILAWLSGRAVAVFGSVTSTLLNLMIALFGLYYLLVGATPLWDRLKRLLPVSPSVAASLGVRFTTVTEALLLGTFSTAVLQGTVVGVGFALVGLSPAVFWGFVTACVSVLPLFGSAIVWLPGVVILVIEQRFGAAVLLGVLGAGLASNLDNIVRLFVYRAVSGIHPMLTLVGAFAGVRFFGVIGAFLGPLVLSYFFELLTVYEETIALPAATSGIPHGSTAPLTVSRPTSEIGVHT